MNAIHRKHVYSDKSIPHFADETEEATHRYRDSIDEAWTYMVARSDAEFLAWGKPWIRGRKPQKRVGKEWRDL